MYVQAQRLSWLQMILKVRGSVLPRIRLRIAFVLLVAIAVTIVHEKFDPFRSLTTTPFVLIGLPLGIFLGFRNSSSYDRFWEGRRLWGSIVNTSRTFARQAQTLLVTTVEAERDEVGATQRELIEGVIGYVHALRMHLRDQVSLDELAAHLPAREIEALRGERNVPVAILGRLGRRLGECFRRGWIHPQHLPLLEGCLGVFTDCQGGCERIRATPVPFSYIVLIHQLTGFYCLLLPLGLVDSLHYFTPVAALFVSYALLGLDAIGDEIEDPFGLEVNDLPLLAISRTIEINLRQALGDKDPPAPIAPVDGVLR